ncbi:hypothetical protein HZA56_21505 [Candidatus Poribacteria bacterium]|nr:hypothetical protein [Candidatus Poribacteria bacterium]
MFDFFRRLAEPYLSPKWRDAQEQKAFDAVFEDIPSDSERRCMSEKELAEVLSACKSGTPAYILIEHELNRRIARIQAIPTYVGVVSGVISALAGIVLGAWSNSYFQQVPVVNCVYPTPTAQKAESGTFNSPTPPRPETITKEKIKPLGSTKPAPTNDQ